MSERAKNQSVAFEFLIISAWLKGSEMGRSKRGAEGVVPLKKDELAAEESWWRRTEEAKLSVEAAL